MEKFAEVARRMCAMATRSASLKEKLIKGNHTHWERKLQSNIKFCIAIKKLIECVR